MGSQPLTWTQFTIIFLEKNIPLIKKDELHVQFENLHYEGMCIVEYEMKFVELSCYATFLIPTETKKVRRFIEGLNYGNRFWMARETKTGTTFSQAM